MHTYLTRLLNTEVGHITRFIDIKTRFLDVELEYLTRLLNTEVVYLTRFLNIDVGYSKKGVELHEYPFEDRKYKTKYQ